MTHTVPENATPADVHPHADLIAGLIELAEWYREHPDVPAPLWPEIYLNVKHVAGGHDDVTGPAEAARIAGVLGVPVTEGGGHTEARRKFGPVELHVLYIQTTRMGQHVAEQGAIKDLKAAGWKPGDPVPTPAASDRTESTDEVFNRVTGAALAKQDRTAGGWRCACGHEAEHRFDTGCTAKVGSSGRRCGCKNAPASDRSEATR